MICALPLRGKIQHSLLVIGKFSSGQLACDCLGQQWLCTCCACCRSTLEHLSDGTVNFSLLADLQIDTRLWNIQSPCDFSYSHVGFIHSDSSVLYLRLISEDIAEQLPVILRNKIKKALYGLKKIIMYFIFIHEFSDIRSSSIYVMKDGCPKARG